MSEQGSTGYERSDVRISVLVRFTIGLGLAIVVSLLVVRGMLSLLDARVQREEALREPPSHATGEAPRPIEPVLQGAPGSRFPLEDPLRELEAVREEQRAKLNGGGLPIDAAKERLLERGLPVRPASELPR